MSTPAAAALTARASSPARKVTDTNDFTSVNDIIALIQTNAEILFPAHKDLRTITGSSRSWHYAALAAADPKSASAHREFKVVVQGVSEATRRGSLLKLLEEVEGRVAKGVMKK